MALIVTTSKSVMRGGKPHAKSETLVFESEKEGKRYVEENKTWVINYQKAGIVYEQRSD